MYKKKTRFDRVRFGITATKKIGKACVRNRARRLIFESFRLFYDSINGDCDIVIIAKPNITEAGFSDILKETERLLKKAELISD